jgi:uncharacterized protein (DUF885 family)
MRARRLLAALAAFALVGATPAASGPMTGGNDGVSPVALNSEEARLNRLFADDARREEQLRPLERLYRGELPDPVRFERLFTDELDRAMLASARASLAELQRIDRARLRQQWQLSYDVFAHDKREEVAWLQPDVRALTAVRPLNHFGGLHVEFPTLMAHGGAVPYASTADYRRALALSAAFTTVLDQAVARFREGLATGVVDSALTISNVIGQIDALLALPIEQSPFYSPVRGFPAAIGPAFQEQLREAYAEEIRERINPAYRRLRDFLHNEYLPAARAEPGLSAMRGGAGLYRQLIERQTTLQLDPDEVHRLGQREVARIQREMQAVKREMGFDGTLPEFFEHVRDDPRYHPSSKGELDEGFARIAKAVEAQIPRFFLRTPRTPLVIQHFPELREKYEAGGSYNQGSLDGSRPGTFFYNTYDLPSRFLTGMTTLYLHEAVPGHHFQISLAQENTALPDFQRFGGNNAFVEGWALYAETLGFDMGLYADPAQHWGTLDDEMLRAMRLVVDTGLHTKGWSRERAIEYMLANSGMGRTDAESEVDRYVANPAQALSYKIGGLTIQRLRRKAESALGKRFDIRQFHDQVLDSGALPLPILEAKIDRWIATDAARRVRER